MSSLVHIKSWRFSTLRNSITYGLSIKRKGKGCISSHRRANRRPKDNQSNYHPGPDLKLRVRPNIYSIRELLEQAYMLEPVLQNQSHRIAMTLGNSGISERSLSDCSIFLVS